jgi:hypothetical protein
MKLDVKAHGQIGVAVASVKLDCLAETEFRPIFRPVGCMFWVSMNQPGEFS